MEREVVICYVYCVSDTRNEGGNYCSEMVRRALEFQRQQHAIPLKVRQQHIHWEIANALKYLVDNVLPCLKIE